NTHEMHDLVSDRAVRVAHVLRELLIGERCDVRIPDVAVLTEVIVIEMTEDIGDHVATMYARTGNVPPPTHAIGTACRRPAPDVSDPRFVMCSQIGIPAPSKSVWAGRDMSAMSSMFNASIPTRAGRASTSLLEAAAVKYGLPLK